MLTKRVPVQERERRRIVSERSVRDEQFVAIAMSNWSGASPMNALVTRAFARAIIRDSKLPQAIRDIPGMSGQLYRSFINNLVEAHAEARYLEVGSWAGSTATAALYGNAARCVCVDNWSQFGGPKDVFFGNIQKVLSEKTDFTFIEADFGKLDFHRLGAFNIYMFDGPHGEAEQYDGVMRAQPALEKTHILIVDDWNWPQVREGTFRALVDSKCTIQSWIEVRTTLDDSHAKIAFTASDWHNGYFIAVVEKPA